MRQKFNYTTIDTILSKFNRDLRGTDVSESDIIEWTGEALGFMKIIEIQEEALAFLEVKDYQAQIPDGFQYVIQIAKNNNWKNEEGLCPEEIVENMELEDEKGTVNFANLVLTDCQGNLISEPDIAYYRPYFDLKYEYSFWMDNVYYRENYTPVRLANHTFLNSLVADVPEEMKDRLYGTTSRDEYTIVGGFPNLCLRFSFREGAVALAYVRARIDEKTGFPLIPDDSNFITAITYYVKWKLAERMRWNGREGFATEVQEAERLWLKYIRQGLNMAKMPQGVDDYQNMLEESLYLIPRHRKYYGYFGKLGREETRLFNNPDRRRKFTQNRYGRY